MSEAVILIPGIKGNHLIDVNTTNYNAIWRDVRFNFEDVEKLELTSKYKNKYFDEEPTSIIEKGQVEKSIRTYISYMVSSIEDREDIFQDVYSNFYKKVRSGFIPENPIGYLRNMTRNHIYRNYRDKKEYVEIENIQEQWVSETKLENAELFDLIKDSLNILDDKYKEVFILKEIEGLSHDEIANTCNISVANSRARLFRAYKQITEILKPYISEIKDQKWIT
jgi:RNA polymerase sigma-70 factor (ECF subfamily)